MSKAENTSSTTPQSDKAAALWITPEIANPSEPFKNYLAVRQYVREHISTAEEAPETPGQLTEVDKLLNIQQSAAKAVQARTPTSATDMAELAVVLRDQIFEPGQIKPYAMLSDQEVAQLLALAIATPTLQNEDAPYDPASLTFEAIDPCPLLDAVNKACTPESTAFNGERFALCLLGKSKEQLLALLRDMPDEPGKDLVDSVCCALQCLEDRVRLVKSAFARLSVCADILGAEQAPEQVLPVEG